MDTESLHGFCSFVRIPLCSSGWPPTQILLPSFSKCWAPKYEPLGEYLDSPSLLNYFFISFWIISPAMFSSSPIFKNHEAPNLQLFQSIIFSILNFLSYTLASSPKHCNWIFLYIIHVIHVYSYTFVGLSLPCGRIFSLVYIFGTFWVDVWCEAVLGICLLRVCAFLSNHHICAVPKVARRERQISLVLG